MLIITRIINPSLDFTNVKKLNRKFFWKKVLGVVYIYKIQQPHRFVLPKCLNLFNK